MICDYYGGPNDGGTTVISDEKCDIGTVHEFVCQGEDCSAVPMHADFADPAVVQARTATAFYRLIGIVSCRSGQTGHLEYLRPK